MTIAVISMIRDPWGGSEELWYAMAKAAVAQGHRVIHLRFEHPVVAPKIGELQQIGVQCFTRPGYIRPGSGPAMRLVQVGTNFLRKKLRDPFSAVFQLKPDVVLYNGTCYSIAGEKGLMKQVQQSKARFFLLGHLNADFIREINDNEAGKVINAYRHAEKLLFVSHRSHETAERHLAESIPNAMIVRNPVNMVASGAIPFPALEPTVNFALVGRLYTSQKGQDVLLQALAGERWRHRNWKLNVYGDGPDKHYLERLCQHYGLQGKMVFHGSVANIRQLWAENHMLLMPSLMEGMPLAVVEAMLCGRPCVVTDVGGNAEWIEHGKSGFLVTACTVNALDKALEEAWQVLPSWEAMGVAAAARAETLYDQDAGGSLLQILLGKGATGC